MEAFQISYDAKPTWGERTTFNITRYADLMYTMIVEIDIPQIHAKNTSDNEWTGPGKSPNDFNTPDAVALNSTTTIGTNVSKTVVGTTINLTATTVNTLFGSNNFLQATLTVVGRDSGARLTIPVAITKTSAN